MVDPHCPIANCSIHDLFNELQRRLFAEAERDNDHRLKGLSEDIDSFHHDYTDIITPNPADALHDELIDVGDYYHRED